jgi:serine/threonine protein phosphatase PrpC
MRKVCAGTNTGKVRSNNEDFFFVDEALGLYILADGMGGARAGERASKLAVETVEEFCRAAKQLDASVLLESFEKANRRVLAESRADPHLEGMGTTLVAVADLGDSFAIASVGDSRAYVFDAEGLRTITEDQTWAEEIGRPLGLDDAAISKHPFRHVLTMALGVGDSVDVRYYKITPNPPATIMISSDGLHGVIPRSRIETILGENSDGCSTPDEKCAHLIEAAREAGGPDNITVILIHIC